MKQQLNSSPRPANVRSRWSITDIVLASTLAVACGVIFWAWNLSYHLVSQVFAFYPPIETLLHGMWLFPAVLGALVIRKPGAALYTEMVAAVLSSLLGSQWGMTVLVSGLFQGLGAELVFLALLYSRFSLPVAVLAGASSGVTGGLNYHFVLHSYAYAPAETIINISAFALSGAVIAGVLSWFAVRAMAATGALKAVRSRRAHLEPIFGASQ